MTDKTRFIDTLYNRTFSSFCFGGIFGCWLLITVVVGVQDGWKAVLISAAGYIVVFATLMAVGWLLGLGTR